MSLYAGLDWLTITGRDPHGDDFEFQDVCDWMDELEKEKDRKPWKMLGYVGQICGPLAIGFRDDSSYICRISGAFADVALVRLPWLATCHFTRVDYQVTSEGDYGKDFVKGWYEKARVNKTLDRQMPEPTYWSSRMGDTLYLGERSSATKYLRLYDKGGEEGGQPGLKMRWEVEFKRRAAPSAWKAWLDAPNRTAHIIDIVSAEFLARGINTKFGSVVAAGIQAEKPRPDSERQLAWLRRCVEPVVTRLVKRGFEDEVRRILFLELPDGIEHEAATARFTLGL